MFGFCITDLPQYVDVENLQNQIDADKSPANNFARLFGYFEAKIL